jgi:putative DNA primase/helicase
MLFNFRNGMLNLRTEVLEPHSQDQLSTIQFPFDFQPDAPYIRWHKFLLEVFQENELLALLLQEIFGYVLIPDTSMQRMFWFVGEGANGKGVAIKILEALIDKSNRTCLDIRNLQNPFVRAAMYNKLVAVQGDFPKKFYGNEDLVKTIVGGDTLDAQEKFKPQFEFAPFCRFIFAMNALPETKDLSKGFFRRVVIVPFTRTFSEDEQDRNLEETLRNELPGIFLWALEGLKRLVENKRFTESPDALKALENYKQEHNTVGQFVDSECVLGGETKCKGSDLWSSYEIFCAECGIEPLSRKGFAVQLKRAYPVTVKTHRWGNDDTPSRTYFGIGLKEK